MLLQHAAWHPSMLHGTRSNSCTTVRLNLTVARVARKGGPRSSLTLRSRPPYGTNTAGELCAASSALGVCMPSQRPYYPRGSAYLIPTAWATATPRGATIPEPATVPRCGYCSLHCRAKCYYLSAWLLFIAGLLNYCFRHPFADASDHRGASRDLGIRLRSPRTSFSALHDG